MTSCYFSAHADAEDRGLVRDIFGCYFSDVIDITSKSSLPEVVPGSFLFSDRTRFFFKQDYLDLFEDCFNVHPSMLPTHKGSYPMLWATLLQEDHGLSIHQMNAEVDAGDIVWQQKISYTDDETFSHLFYRSRQYVIHALHDVCNQLCNGVLYNNVIHQKGSSSFHHLKNDGEKLLSQLPNRWNTQIGVAREILADQLRSYN